VEEPFDQPAFRSAVARGLIGKNGVDGHGKWAMQELPAILEQVALLLLESTLLFLLSSFTDWAAEVDKHGSS